MGEVDAHSRFAGRSAIVTGAGSGIGAALSRSLVAAGAHVVCADLDLDSAEKTVASVTGFGSASLDPEVLADDVLVAVTENRPLLVTPRTARIAWRIGRLSPSLVAATSIRFVAKQRRLQAKRAARER